MRILLRRVLRIVLSYLAFLSLITCVGYYALIFDWHIPGAAIVRHIAVLAIAIAASIWVYGIAEKLRTT